MSQKPFSVGLDSPQSKSEKLRMEFTRKEIQREKDDISAVLKLPEGRRFVYRLLSRAGIFGSTFYPDALKMAFAEGQRNFGLWLLGEVEVAEPESMLQMQREDRSRKSSEEALVNEATKEDADEQQDD